jgi:hypothetical protein
VTADLAIGSGTQGRSFLTVDRGAVWQSPVSWYHGGGKWDLSPGFDPAGQTRRPVVAGCLRCHTNRPEPIAGSVNLYRDPVLTGHASIGCERCHGPGELHAAERANAPATDGLDTSVVNPARLPADLKADVCRQCHLQGQAQVACRGRDLLDYRPGLPWDHFASTFVPHPALADPRQSVGHFEQVEQSRCFEASAGRLSCVSCHDPHALPDAGKAAEYYRGRCLICHESRGCTAPAPSRAAKADSCIACHMPRRDSSNIAHTAVTDHHIPRRADPAARPPALLRPGELPLVPYPPGPHAPPAAERDRDWAVALGNEFARSRPPAAVWPPAETKLDAALRRSPDDAAALLARSRVYAARGDTARAVEAARAAVGLEPDSEAVLAQLAVAAVAADDFALAIRATDRLVPMNPSSTDHLLTRATAYLYLKDWDRAEADCRAALAIHPLLTNARLMVAACRHRRGDPAGGQRELDAALRLTANPRAKATLTDLYRQLTR